MSDHESDHETERSKGGSRILRHEATDRAWEDPVEDAEAQAAIEAHIETHVGPVGHVFHELVSERVHIDVHIVPPSPERNLYTLVTTGMSDRPMNAPPGAEELRYAELVMVLPPDWCEQPLWEVPLDDQRHHWPVRLMQMLARLPHQYDSFLSYGHTIPTGDPPVPYADDTELCCALILVPLTLPEAFYRLEIRPEKSVAFWAVVPILRDEMQLKLEKGTEALFPGFDRCGVTEIVDRHRASSVRKKFLGLF